jgi:hypothetical protein
MARYVTGWKLPRDGERERLLDRFPPKYEKIVADHVTLDAHASDETPLPRATDAQIVGYADDGESLECLVVSIGGTTDRPDGSTFHITWSLGQRREAKESNDVLREKGWQPLDRPVPIDLDPARFKW